MKPEPRRSGAGGSSATRRLLAAVALALALIAAVDHLASRRASAELIERVEATSSEPLPAATKRRVAVERDPADARLALARRLVVTELGTLRPPDQAPTDRLELARRLAAEAYRQRPASWQAPMLIGAATYLSRSIARDRRLVTAATDWERPLTVAHTLGSGRDEPGRFLAAAYLELWPFLSAEKQALATGLLRRAMSDAAGFDDLIDPWLAVAEDRTQALAALPLEPFVWQRMLGRFASAADWAAYLEALPYARRAEEAALEELLAGAEARRRGGELREARGLYFAAAIAARPSLEHLPILERVLAETPPGPPPVHLRPKFSTWLDWALELCAVGRCPLPEPGLRRLAGFADAAPATVELALRAAAAANDRPRSSAESRSTGSWPAESWTWATNRARLRWTLAQPARVEIRIAAGAPADGAVVGVQVDGRDRGAFVARSGSWLAVDGTVEPGRHSLELFTLAGRPVRPGEVRARPPES